MKELHLSDEQWQCVEHFFSHFDCGRERPRRPDREILDAILWVQTNDEKWHHLPSRYPPQQTCYARYIAWRRNGLLHLVLITLERAGMPIATEHLVED